MSSLFFLVGALLALAGSLIKAGGLSVDLVAGGCFAINLVVNGQLWRWDHRYIAYKMFAAFSVAQSGFLFIALLFFSSSFGEMYGMSTLFTTSPYTLLISFNLVPLVALGFAWMLDYFERSERLPAANFAGLPAERGEYSWVLPDLGPAFGAILILGAFINVSVWVSTLDQNLVYYVLRALNKSLGFLPFLAGLYWNRNRLVRFIWISALAIDMVLAFFTGSRGYAFIPLGFYGIGFILQHTTSKARWRWFFGSLGGVGLLVVLSGFIGLVREEFGRSDIRTMNVDEVVSHLNDVMARDDSANSGLLDIGQDSALWHGLSRLVDDTLVVVPNMSPGIVPFRGFGDFPDELMAMASFPGLGINPDWHYASRLNAIQYGFTAYEEQDANGMVGGSSVPFGVVVDAWSRAGFLLVIPEVVLVMAFLIGLERLNMRVLHARNLNMFVLVRCVICGIAVTYLPTYTFIESIRETTAQIAGIMLFVGGFNLLTEGMFGHTSSWVSNAMRRRPRVVRPG